ncbi:VWA domain-containing protein [Catellatospora sp. KI3]|uniref:vWA domain-containing protein n=1 Tax=Catellatospora sp. KI3 TaxID=3041620 RepID=UPI0024825D8F|nr:VWA domain-containing protein [Catellatospora sp. KI3]MDI1466064.1 VWA domain-containing protein [Catellatospora sp. KI3]
MTVMHPLIAVAAALVSVAAVAAYVRVQRRRARRVRATGFGLPGTGRRAALRRHTPYALFLAALPLLLFALARPQAELPIPHLSSTVVLVFDVSNSMAATDVAPSRLAAAQAAATEFVRAQPDTVDVGVVIFGQSGLITLPPSDRHDAAEYAISRLTTSGGTSLTQAILTALGVVVGRQVTLPTDQAPAPDLGYWGSATIVLFSDGQDTPGPGTDVATAAQLAADAGVHIETVGIGTAEGTTIEVDGYQVATALDEQTLTGIAAITGAAYHPAADSAALHDLSDSIDLRVSTRPEQVELTALLAGAALLLLLAGALLMIRWHGRIV